MNHENETAFCGCLLTNPEKVMPIAARFTLTPDHFTNPDARAIFSAADKLHSKGRPIDGFTVKTESGVDIRTVQELIDNAVTWTHAEFHGRAIMAAHIRRQAIAELKSAGDMESMRRVFESHYYATSEAAGGAVQACTAAAWLTEPDEAEQPIIEGLCDAGDRVSIVGQSKARKSFFALQVALSIATGREFFGRKVTAQKTLLVNGEISGRAYKRRLRRMLAKLDIQGSLENLVIANTSEAGAAQTYQSILHLAKKHAAAVVVIDPAYLLLTSELDEIQLRRSIFDMKKFTAEGITLAQVFHAKKGKIGDSQIIDRISGGGVLARDYSTLFSLCEHATEPDHVVMSFSIRNHPPSDPLTIEFHDGAFIATDYAPIEKTSSTRTRREIPLADAVKLFPGDKDISYSNAIELLTTSLSIGRNRAIEILSKGRDAGLLHAMRVGRSVFYKPIQPGDMV